MLVGMCLFQEYKGKSRLNIVKRFYDAASTFKISLPTPIMAGVRTPTRQFSSCVLIESDDDLDSISAAALMESKSSSDSIKTQEENCRVGVLTPAIIGVGNEILKVDAAS